MNTGLKAAAIAFLAAPLGACVIVDADVEGEWDDFHGRAGFVYAASVDPQDQQVSVTVRSNGCTRKEHFRTQVERRGRERFSVAFHRVTEDHCKALVPDGERLTWTFQELGLPPNASITIANPVGS